MLQNNYNIIIMHILYTVLLYIVAIHTLYIALLHRDALMYSYLRYIPCRLMNCAYVVGNVIYLLYYTVLYFTILSTHFLLPPSHTAEYCVHGVYYGHCTHTFIPTTPLSVRGVLPICYFLQQQSL